MSRREQSKSNRRERIIDAAYAILAEQGDERLSMELIAQRSGLSVMTIYNLIGSKNAVLLDVVRRVTDRAAERLRERPYADALDRILNIMEFTREAMLPKQPLYAHLNQVMFSHGNSELRHASNAFQRSLWIEFFQNAIDDGFINEELHPDTLTRAIEAIFYANYFEFADGAISLERFICLSQCGFCLVLLGACNKRYRSRLMSRLLHWQDAATLTDS